jgi:DNA-directed RNA polymerase specialized sigma24 family protein
MLQQSSLRQAPTTRFPDTRHSVLEALRTDDAESRREAADLIVRAYRAPVLAALTWKWDLEPADADDLVQDFFATALEKGWLERFDPAKAKFRTFLRMTADRFAAKARLAALRLKRGGALSSRSLEDQELIGTDGDAESDRKFREVWVRSVFEMAHAALADEARLQERNTHLSLFEAYDLSELADDARPTYADLGRQHGLNDTQVINHLAWARRRFRSHVLEVLRRLAGSDAEYREDVRDLLGIAAP